MRNFIFLLIFLFHQTAFAIPHWNQQKVPKDYQFESVQDRLFNSKQLKILKSVPGIDILRIQIDWQANESYVLKNLLIEPSGTEALLKRSKLKPRWGSYIGILKDSQGQKVYYDSVGTGREYRRLTRAINFRFPVPQENMTFELYAENPTSGIMEKVLSKPILRDDLPKNTFVPTKVEVRELLLAKKTPALRVNIYAEGYLKGEEDTFWQHAMKTVRVLQKEKFPGVDNMSFYAVFAPSNRKLGQAKKLGYPVPTYDTFLGLYYPYWTQLGRWYNGMYPTNENKLREGLASAPYDYPLILTNSDGYWGVGNYMSLTAIPAASSFEFTYLLMHEFGHYFGLNEEYNGGGPTELEFAPDIAEPWSQNITFLANKAYQQLKWKSFVDPKIPLPTPNSVWKSKPPVYGAYRGGYGDSPSNKGVSHIPGLSCIMESDRQFCDICTSAIREVVQYSLGETA